MTSFSDDVVARDAQASQTKIGAVGPSSQAGISLGTAADAKVWRDTNGRIRITGDSQKDAFRVGSSSAYDFLFWYSVASPRWYGLVNVGTGYNSGAGEVTFSLGDGGATPKLQLRADGNSRLLLGPGSGSALDAAVVRIGSGRVGIGINAGNSLSGAGAAHFKSEPWYDVRAWGADPANTRAVNTPAIQAAIDAAAATPGSFLYFPPGNYQANELYWRDGVGCRGTWMPTDGIVGSTLDAPIVFTNASHVEVDYTAHTEFRDMNFRNSTAIRTGTCIYSRKQQSYFYSYNCTFGGNPSGNAAVLIDVSANAGRTVERLKFIDCVFYDCSYGFVYNGGTTSSEFSKSVFDGCHFASFEYDAISVVGLLMKTMKISDCVFQGYPAGTGKTSRRAIYISAEVQSLSMEEIFTEDCGTRSNGGTPYAEIEIVGFNDTGPEPDVFHNPLTGFWHGGAVGQHQGTTRHADCPNTIKIGNCNLGFGLVGIMNLEATVSLGANVWTRGCNFMASTAAPIQTWRKSGIPSDSEFPGVGSGMIVLDETNNRLYVRVGSTWRYTALT